MSTYETITEAAREAEKAAAAIQLSATVAHYFRAEELVKLAVASLATGDGSHVPHQIDRRPTAGDVATCFTSLLSEKAARGWASWTSENPWQEPTMILYECKLCGEQWGLDEGPGDTHDVIIRGPEQEHLGDAECGPVVLVESVL
jgi:hypothetical protein